MTPFKAPRAILCCPKYSWRYGLSLGITWLTRIYTLRGNQPSLSQRLTIANLFRLGVGLWVCVPAPCWDVVWLGLAQSLCMLSWVQCCSAVSKRWFLITIDCLWLLHSFCLLFCRAFNHREILLHTWRYQTSMGTQSMEVLAHCCWEHKMINLLQSFVYGR